MIIYLIINVIDLRAGDRRQCVFIRELTQSQCTDAIHVQSLIGLYN